MSSLVCKPKIKSNKARTKKPIQAEVVTFYNIVRKVAIAPKCLEEEAVNSISGTITFSHSDQKQVKPWS